MASKKISELTAPGALTGTELVEVVQGGVNKQTTAQDIADLSSGGTGIVETIVAGTNITVDDTDPANPIISASGGGGAAEDITFAPAGNISATDVQAALEELDAEKLSSASLDGKSDALVSLRTETASHTLDATDLTSVNDGESLVIMMNVGSANNLTIPLNATQAFPVGTVIGIRQIGAGQTTIVATGGVTVNAPLNALKLAAQNALAFIEKTATDTWYANGELSL